MQGTEVIRKNAKKTGKTNFSLVLTKKCNKMEFYSWKFVLKVQLLPI